MKALSFSLIFRDRQSLEKMNSLLHENKATAIYPKIHCLVDTEKPTYCANYLQFYYSYLYLQPRITLDAHMRILWGKVNVAIWTFCSL